MASSNGKTTIDFDDYSPPPYEEYDGDEPRPGWYTFDLETVGWYGEDESDLRWIFKIAEGPFAGWPGFVYANFDSTKWKNQEVVRAIQGGKEASLSVDFGNDRQVAALVKKAKRVRGKVELRTNRETGDQRLSLRKVRPLLEEVGGTKVSKATEVDDLEEATADEPEGDLEGYTEEELGGMKLIELKKILKEEFEFSAADLRKIRDTDAAIDAILDAQDEAGDEGDEDTDDEGDEDGDFDAEFDDGEDGDDADADEEPEPEPEPEPAPRTRRTTRATKTAAPAARKAAPAKAAPATRTRRTRRG